MQVADGQTVSYVYRRVGRFLRRRGRRKEGKDGPLKGRFCWWFFVLGWCGFIFVVGFWTVVWHDLAIAFALVFFVSCGGFFFSFFVFCIFCCCSSRSLKNDSLTRRQFEAPASSGVFLSVRAQVNLWEAWKNLVKLEASWIGKEQI